MSRIANDLFSYFTYFNADYNYYHFMVYCQLYMSHQSYYDGHFMCN